jgi:hypothetical protein
VSRICVFARDWLVSFKQPAHTVAVFACLVIFRFAGWAFSPVVFLDGTRIDTMTAFAAVHSPAFPIREADAVSDFSAHSAKGDGLLPFCHLQAILRSCGL